MSLYALADHMASKGRNGDSMLVHMAPSEVAGLHALALAHGEKVTINPETGLPEMFSLKSVLKAVLPAVAGVALGPAGFGVMSSLGAAATVGGATALATGSLSRGLMAGLGAYGGSSLGEGLMGAGAGAAQQAAMSGLGEGASQAAMNEAAAQATKDFASQSLFDRAGAGLSAAVADPKAFMQGMGGGTKTLGAAYMAASPMLADQGVQTTTKMPESQGYLRPYVFDPYTQGLKALTPVSHKDAYGPPPGSKDGGLMKLANGGAVAFADGGDVVGQLFKNIYGRPAEAWELENVKGMSPEQIIGVLNTSKQAFDAQSRPPAQPDTSGFTVGPTQADGYNGFANQDQYNAAVLYKAQEDAAKRAALEAYQVTGTSGYGDFYTRAQADPSLLKKLHGESDEDALMRLKYNVMDAEQRMARRAAMQRDAGGGGFTTGPGEGGGGGGTQPGPGTPTPPPPGPGTPPPTQPPYTPPPFTWGDQPITRLPEFGPIKPEDAMSGRSLEAYNALMGKGSTATKQWDQAPMRPYLPQTGNQYFIQRGDSVVDTKNPSTATTPAPSTFTDPNQRPTAPPGPGMEWFWDGINKMWLQRPADSGGFGGDSGGFGGDSGGGGMGNSGEGGGGPGEGGWARGGYVPSYALGGLGSLGGYSDGGRLLKGPGDGVSDSIPATIGDRRPARLADGEFVVPARIVSELGNGSTDAGARKLYAMMDRVQKARGKTTGKGRVAANTRADKYLPA